MSYWASDEDIHEYYLDTIREDGYEPVSIVIDISAMDSSLIEPDYPGIEEPLTYTLKTSEDTVWEKWENSSKTWRDSIEIIGSIRFCGLIHPDLITVLDKPLPYRR